MRWKTQCRNQQHALDYSAIGDNFITKQNDKLLAVYEQQLVSLEKAIHQLIEQDAILKEQVERLTAIKGLALLSVAVLIAETNGFEGFANQRQLVSYADYDVIENQSGNRSGKTRISKKGNSRIRRILHLPAFNRSGAPCGSLWGANLSSSLRTSLSKDQYQNESLCGCAKEVTPTSLRVVAPSN